MRARTRTGAIGLVLLALLGEAGAQNVPQSAREAWSDFDPAADPLEVEIIRESIVDGIVQRHVRFAVATFGTRRTRVAGHYAFPKDGAKLPGIVQLHGGGQRARVEEARYWASQGYAAIALNWGELPISENKADPNTDWAGIPAGFVEPKHHNPVSPGEGTVYPVAHPWNSSWMHYAAAARRAITFLQAQPEVHGLRIGMTGHSMGGRLTVLSAIDGRVKAASPSVGGSGFLYDDIPGVPGSRRHMINDRALYNRTLGCEHYWPLIKCPLLFLGATNDFNSPMELVYRGFRSLPAKNGSLSFTPHMNHRFTADNYAARVRWFETHLKGSFDYPKRPKTELFLERADGIPLFAVTPDRSTGHKVKSIVIYYGYERDPRVRFWHGVPFFSGSNCSARCPVQDLDEPLFIFANVTYDTGKAIELPRGYGPTSLLTVTSELVELAPHELINAGVKETAKRSREIDGFGNRWQDWSAVSANNPHHFSFKTHKIHDSRFFGPRGAELVFNIETSAPGNTLAVVMETDQWRGYTGRKTKRFTALAKLERAGMQRVRLLASAFIAPDGEKLPNYDFVTALILTPGNKERPEEVKGTWKGKVPILANMRWEGGEFAPRKRPYLGARNAAADADAAFREQFEKEVRESVEQEKKDADAK